MASLKVADPLDLAAVHYYAMHTNASAVPIKSHQFSSLLNEFEHWSTIVPNLSRDQGREISEHLQEQLSQLATFEEPQGTRQQQYLDLERLAKLQKGPLAKMMYDVGYLMVMDDIICKRLRALSGKTVDVGPEVVDSTDTSRTSTPDSNVGTEPGENDLKGRTELILKSAKFTSSSHSNSYTLCANIWISLEDDVLLLFHGPSCPTSITKEEINGVSCRRQFGGVVLEMEKGNWSILFNNAKDEGTLRSWIRGLGLPWC